MVTVSLGIPISQEVRQDMYGNLPPRGSIIPNLFPAEGRGREGVRGIESSKVTSVSQCESDRGTHGRGTPPTREEGQPRLDELFRQLQLKQVCLLVRFPDPTTPARIACSITASDPRWGWEHMYACIVLEPDPSHGEEEGSGHHLTFELPQVGMLT